MREVRHNPTTGGEGPWPRKTGMTVPEGYFDSFAVKMMEQIPQVEPRVVEMPRRTVWQTIRPYVYMAAMFAGVWLMMNMFSLFTPGASISSSASQSLLAEVTSAQSETYFADYMSSVSDYDLYDDLYDSGFDVPETL